MITLEFTPLLLPLAIAALWNLSLATYSWSRRRFPGAVMLGALMAALTEWTIAYGLVISATDVDTKMFWYHVEYIGVVASSALWVLFVVDYAGWGHRVRRWHIGLLAVEPLVTLGLAFTNRLHCLMWSNWTVQQTPSFKALVVDFGPWYWCNVAYGYALFVGGSVVLAWALARRRRLYFLQATSLVIGVAAPLIGNIIYNTGLVGALDLAPFAFTVSGLTWWFGLAHYRLLEVAPVATPLALETVFEGMADGVVVLDAGGSVVKHNQAAADILEVYRSNGVDDPLPALLDHLSASAGRTANRDERVELALQQGDARRHFDVRWSPLSHRTGAPAGKIIALRDVTDRKRAEEALAHQARHDALTGLPNRTFLLDSLREALERARRDGERLALLFADLDNFKTVNDSLGHSAGDDLLVAVAERLRACVRPGDLVARLGGDEFAIVLTRTSTPSTCAEVAGRIIQSLSEPFALMDAEVVIGASIGISISDTDATRPNDLLRNADAALYAAKAHGRGRFEFFAEEMHQAASARLAFQADLRRALAAREFRVYYQPVVCLSSGQIVGCEALVRWQHPVRGLVPPLEFIPICEETGLIVPLGELVLREVFVAQRHWQALFSDGSAPVCSVNVSPRQLQQPDFLQRVAALLQETGADPASVILEITEGVLLDDGGSTLGKLQELSSMGFRLAIDDFGTGYSALSYLQRFPIDVLKIDRSFVQSLGQGGARDALVRAIVALGQALNLRLVAEGIEHPEQQQQLAALGCELGQGYWFGQAEPREVFEGLLQTQSAKTSTAGHACRAHAERAA